MKCDCCGKEQPEKAPSDPETGSIAGFGPTEFNCYWCGKRHRYGEHIKMPPHSIAETVQEDGVWTPRTPIRINAGACAIIRRSGERKLGRPRALAALGVSVREWVDARHETLMLHGHEWHAMSWDERSDTWCREPRVKIGILRDDGPRDRRVLWEGVLDLRLDAPLAEELRRYEGRTDWITKTPARRRWG